MEKWFTVFLILVLSGSLFAVTTVTKYVDTDLGTDDAGHGGSVGSGAYKSLNYAQSANEADLTAGDGTILHIICTGDTTDTTKVSVDGYTTSVTCYLWFTGQNTFGIYDASKYLLQVASDWNVAFANNTSYLIVDGMQIIATGADALGVQNTGGAGIVCFSNCLIKAVKRCVEHRSASATGYMVLNNCVLKGAIVGLYNYDGPSMAYNSCFVNNSSYGVQAIGYVEPIICKNCYAGGNGVTDFKQDANGTLTRVTCHSSDTSGNTQTAFSTSSGAYFTNVTAGSEDLHISTSSTLKNAGTNLSADGYWVNPNGTKDVDGDAMGTWPVGIDELIETTTIVPAIMRRRQN
jgi:hypothetical protein